MNKGLKIIAMLLIAFASSTAMAQPKIAQQALLTLKTFKTGGEAVGTSYACAIDKDGTVLSGWTPFDGADSAVVVDAAGRTYPVEKIYGANELYNISKFKITGASAIATIPLAKAFPSGAAKLWIVTKKPLQLNLLRTEKFNTKFNYYVLGDKTELKNDAVTYPNGSPIVNERGELVGIYNNGGNVLSATDYRYADDLQTNGFAINDPILRQTTIRKALPADYKGAQLALLMSASGKLSDQIATAQDFIKMFPKENDGYNQLATIYWNQGKTDEADKLYKEAISNVNDKATAHYNYSRAMWQKVALMPEPAYPAWTFDKAMDEANAAYKIDPQPIYDEQKAKIDYSKGNYDVAYQKFMSLTKTPLRNANLFYEAAQCRQQLKGTDDEILALLDSAVNACDTPYTSIAAPYFLARGAHYNKMQRYRDAMLDLYRYEMLTSDRLSSAFYYDREQIEVKARVYQGALNDINRAIILDDKNSTLWAEKANLHMRVGQYDDAIKAADIGIELDSTYSTPYLIKGVAQCQSGKKEEGLQNLEKAKSLGDTQADSFIDKFKK